MRKVVVSERGIESLFGNLDENLRAIEKGFQVGISARGSNITLEGESRDVEMVAELFRQLSGLLKKGYSLKREDVEVSIRLLKDGDGADLEEFFLKNRVQASRHRVVSPRSSNQRKYIDAIRQSDMVFAIGPAGTGKTYLAVAMATELLAAKKVERIILTRPAVEAGEKLGFLPGDMVQKVDPYLRPLYDALYDLLESARAQDFVERGIIEIAPLAFMRGRTLNDAFVILDEGQNTTSEQMKMFLTRIGFGCKVVITGDITQIDLPSERISGLVEAQQVVGGVSEIHFAYFDERDVVRHPLVRSIIKAYENYRNGHRNPDPDPSSGGRKKSRPDPEKNAGSSKLPDRRNENEK